jgi:hypothetical protein
MLPNRARGAAFERRRAANTTSPGSRLLFEPIQYIGSQPAYFSALKSLFPGKLPNCGHAAKRPRWTPDEPSDIMSGENLIPRRVGFIYPPGDGNSLTDGDAGCFDADLNGICSHKRPSCVVPVVQGQVAT